MIKLLHAADLHLDSAFSALPPEKAAARRREQRQALEQLARLAQGCDLVLLAGDLFDSARIYRDTLDALRAFFAAVRVPVFIAPGNHDAFVPGSPYETEDWGENVHIFSRPELQRVELAELSCCVYGAAFTGLEMPGLLRTFRAQDESACRLMVLHGDLQPGSVYNPITPGEVAASGLTYLALGHVHQRGLWRWGDTLCAMPGCLMGRGFDECGPHGAYVVTITEAGAQAEFVPLHTRRYEILTVEAGEDPLAAIRAALPENTHDDCYRIVLTGEADAVDTAALEAALAPEFFTLSVRDRTHPRCTLWQGAGEDTLRGHFLARLHEQLAQADEEQQRRLTAAARLVTAMMDGREVEP